MSPLQRKLVAGGLTVLFALIALEGGSYVLLRTGWLRSFTQPLSHFELEASRKFESAAADFGSSRLGKSQPMVWASYHFPPIRNAPLKEHLPGEPDLLVNQFRRIKLNDDPADPEPVDDSAIRILLTGNSTCAGYGATANSRTFAAVLQRRLTVTLGKRVQILNYCVPDYKFSDELIAFLMELNYLRPSLWLSINGDNDASSQNEKLPSSVKYLVGKKRFSKYLLANGWHVLPHFQAVMAIFRSNSVQRQIFNDLVSTSEPSFFRRDEDIFVENFRMAAAMAAANNIKFVHLLQPIMFLDGHAPTPEELKRSVDVGKIQGFAEGLMPARYQGFREFYSHVGDRIRAMIRRREVPGATFEIGLPNVFANAAGKQVYYDPRHYSDVGQELVGEALARELLPIIRSLPNPSSSARPGRD